jgi:purine-binding chemotaxis protein CheW
MTKSNPDSLAVFSLDDQKFALAVASIERIVHAVEIAPLPGAPRGVRGVINFQGSVIPVFDLRVRFGQAGRDVRVTDHLVIANTARRKVVVIVDAAVSVVGAGEAGVVASTEILPGFEEIEGVMKLDGDIILIHDLDRFLSLESERELAAAMSA